MGQEGAIPNDETSGTEYNCDDCDQPFKTAQGLAGHRRLVHSASTRSELESREAELTAREAAAQRQATEVTRRAAATQRREAEVVRREREIADTGPAALGMEPCPECGSWFETSENLRRHRRSIHPIEDAVASEVGRSRQRVEDVWREAARKQERHPDETPEQIVNRFLLPTDQKILNALLAKNATFRFAKKGE